MAKAVQRIALICGNHLCNNPRVVKVADAISDLGYNVTVVGASFVQGLNSRDNRIAKRVKWSYVKAYDFNEDKGAGFFLKLQKKIGEILYKKAGLENIWQLGYGAGCLYRKARKINADLTIAHWEVALPAVVRLLYEGKQVGVDMEDWYSENILPEALKNTPIRLLKRLEKKLLREGVYTSCTSEAMAEALMSEYGCRRPVVIRNVFPVKDRDRLDGKWRDRPGMTKWRERNDPTAPRPKEVPVSIHWFSQTIGPGRGLEILFQALEGVGGNWELHLRGNIKGYEDWLELTCPSKTRKRLTTHMPVNDDELVSRISEHDIGYCGEPNNPKNKNLTISNKFFHYLQAGLAVLASDTEGQMEGASQTNGAVWIFRAGEHKKLAEKLEGLLEDRGALKKMRQSSWQAGARLNWENDSKRIKAALP